MDEKHKLLPIFCLSLVLLLFVNSSHSQILRFDPRNGANRNEITVFCIERHYFRETNPDGSSPTTTQTAMDQYTFNVTPEAEKTLSCSGSRDSEFMGYTTFAAIPIVEGDRRRPLLMYLGDTQQSLMCPHSLGTAAGVIDPYRHVWYEDGVLIAGQNDMNLHVDITEGSPDEYSCAIEMSLCNTTACMDSPEILPAGDRRIVFNITKVERISIKTSPAEEVNVTEGMPASFSCSARGTSTEVIWEFGATEVIQRCNDGSDNVCVMTTRHDGVINSTLVVMSSSLSHNSTDVKCIVRQSFNGTVVGGLNNANFNNSLPDNSTSAETTLIVIPLPTSEPPTPTTQEPTSPMSTTSSGFSSEVSITLITLAIVFVIAVSIIISLVTCLYCHYHYKYRKDSKLGNILRSMSRPSGHGRFVHNHPDHMPTDGNGHIDPDVFQSAYSLNDSGVPESRGYYPNNGAQDVEGIYNTSQYSGLSGVSNQGGKLHTMPYYPSGTDVSGGSANGNGTHLHVYSTVIRRPKSDLSNNSRASSNDPIPLTEEALSKHSLYFNPSPQATRSAQNNPPQNGLQPTGPQHKSDTGLPKQPFYLKRPSPIHVIPSPALAVINGSPTDQPTTDAPFPHKEVAQMSHAPFPSKESNDPKKPGNISADTMESVINCLMHNRNCQIPNCPCYSARTLYWEKMASKKQTDTLRSQQSSSSDSDSTMGKRSKLFLPLSSQDEPGLHPHFHPGRKLLVRGARPRPPLSRRRSRSVDLSPYDCPDAQPKTPKVGGSLIGTPVCAPQHTFEDAINQELQKQSTPFEGANRFLPTVFSSKGRGGLPSPCTPETHNNYGNPSVFKRSNSMSADDIPTLCLNDCPLSHSPRENLKAPPPMQIKRQPSVAGKPALSTIGEKKRSTDESVTSSRSNSPPDLTQSDHDKDNVVSEDSGRGASVSDSIQSVRGHLIRQPTVEHEGPAREMSYGYQSESEASLSTSMCSLKPRPARSVTSIPGSDRSASPAYETVVTYSDDGSQVHTTEC